MARRLLELNDGIAVEIDDPSAPLDEMHASSTERVDTTMNMVSAVVARTIAPMREAFAGLRSTLDVPIAVDTAEVELSVKFSAEGTIYIAKTAAEGSIKITVKFKSLEAPKGKGAE